MSPNFTYRPRSSADWEKRERQSSSRFASFALDDFQTYSPKKGDNYIRVLPPTWDDPHHYGYDLWVHYQVGPDGGTVICPNKMKMQPCPICQAQMKFEAAGREDANDYKATRRVLVWLINRAEEQNQEKAGPFLWAMPWTLDRDISKLCRDRMSGELYQIDHPTDGFDITFEREGEPPIVKYIGIQLARRASSVDAKYLDYVSQHPIPTTLLWRSYDEIQALFEGQYPVDTKQGSSQVVNNTTTSVFPPVTTTEAFTGTTATTLISTVPVIAREEAPVVVPAFCDATVTLRGEKWGCALEAGHTGEHDYGRPMNETKQAMPEKQNGTAVPATPSPATISPRASALRQRFDTGRK